MGNVPDSLGSKAQSQNLLPFRPTTIQPLAYMFPFGPTYLAYKILSWLIRGPTPKGVLDKGPDDSHIINWTHPWIFNPLFFSNPFSVWGYKLSQLLFREWEQQHRCTALALFYFVSSRTISFICWYGWGLFLCLFLNNGQTKNIWFS